jgi:hypothetical protein
MMMSFSKMLLVLITTLLYCQSIFSLEIDEKLTSRFLKVSGSMRTVLINRGLEDGLVVGDHAKFFLTTGVIARGYVVKASPTRTIWSIYRLVNTDKLYKDMAVNLKISNPVEVTEDPTKSLYAGFPQSSMKVLRGDSMAMDNKSGSTESMSSEEQEIESLNELREVSMEAPRLLVDKTRTWETFGYIHFNALSSSINDENGDTFSGENSQIDYSFGVEKYFGSFKSILRNISIFGIVHGGSNTTTSIEGEKNSTSSFEYGGGLNFHFLSSPFAISRVIPFFSGSFGIGSITSKTTILSGNNSGVDGDEVTGDTSFISLGIGAKYFTRSGFGFRALVDLYRRSEKFTFENATGDTEVTRSTSGPRILLGAAYRW